MNSAIASPCDVIVVGGGPAGSTAAYALATRGRRVLVLERSPHPRFHIGESLLPMGTELLDRLGLLGPIEQGPFVHKPGAELGDAEKGHVRVPFSYLPEGYKTFAFNVERAPFDSLLLRSVRDAGGEVLEGASVRRLLFEGGRVVGVLVDHAGSQREFRSSWVVDASGRAGVGGTDRP